VWGALCVSVFYVWAFCLLSCQNESQPEAIIKGDSSAVATNFIYEGKWRKLLGVRKLCTSEFG